MRYFDAHTHVQFAAFAGDEAAVVERAKEAEAGVNIVGTQDDPSLAAGARGQTHED